MKNIIDRLELWRKERGLDKSQGFVFDLDKQVSFLTEEITEYLRAKDDYERIDALCDLTVFSINALSLLENETNYLLEKCYKSKRKMYQIKTILEYIYKLMDKCHYSKEFYFLKIIEICKHTIESNRFNYDLCMNETLLEIESRKGAFNSDTGKWEKFKDEESIKLWYKADYFKCKL